MSLPKCKEVQPVKAEQSLEVVFIMYFCLMDIHYFIHLLILKLCK